MKREDLEWNLGYLLDDAARLMRRAFDARIRHLGLTRAQWFVLAQLYREDGYTQTNLAKLADMDRATLGKVVDRLQEKGLIERRPHPEDRRANLIYITKAFDYVVDATDSVRAKAAHLKFEIWHSKIEIKTSILKHASLTRELWASKRDLKFVF